MITGKSIGIILTSADGGTTWILRTSGINNMLNGVSCPSTRVCVAVGGVPENGANGVSVRSQDGGATWAILRSQYSITPSGYLNSVSCSSENSCVAVGGEGSIITSGDGGATWTSRLNPLSNTLHWLDGVSCPSSNRCVAVGDKGTILTSRDGGATWTSQRSVTVAGLESVSCPNASQCVAVGDKGAILTSRDGGATWAIQASGTSSDLIGVGCPSANSCIAVGGGGIILEGHVQSGATTQSQPLTDLIAGIERLRSGTDQALVDVRGAQEQRDQAVLYFQRHLRTDAASGIATVILDALGVKGAVKLWRGPLHDFIANMSLTNTKALAAEVAKDIGKDVAKELAKQGSDATTAVLIDWLIRGDPRATQAFDQQIALDQQRINTAATQAEAALRAHPPSAAAATAMLAQLKSVALANLTIALQLDAADNLLSTSYFLRSGADQEKTIFDNFFADTALYWGLTALSVPVGGWGGLAYKATKTAFQGLQALGKVTEDAQLVTTGTGAGLSGVVLASQVTGNARDLLAAVRAGTAGTAVTGTITGVAGQVRYIQRGAVSQATLTLNLRNTGKASGDYQAIVTYQHTHYTLPIPQAAYSINYLAKSQEAHIGAGGLGTLTVDFLIGGSGVLPSDGTALKVEVVARSGKQTYFIGKRFVTWQPSSS